MLVSCLLWLTCYCYHRSMLLLVCRRDIENFKKDENLELPMELDYASFAFLSKEEREKLITQRPRTLAQASRISGMWREASEKEKERETERREERERIQSILINSSFVRYYTKFIDSFAEVCENAKISHWQRHSNSDSNCTALNESLLSVLLDFVKNIIYCEVLQHTNNQWGNEIY